MSSQQNSKEANDNTCDENGKIIINIEEEVDVTKIHSID